MRQARITLASLAAALVLAISVSADPRPEKPFAKTHRLHARSPVINLFKCFELSGICTNRERAQGPSLMHLEHQSQEAQLAAAATRTRVAKTRFEEAQLAAAATGTKQAEEHLHQLEKILQEQRADEVLLNLNVRRARAAAAEGLAPPEKITKDSQSSLGYVYPALRDIRVPVRYSHDVVEGDCTRQLSQTPCGKHSKETTGSKPQHEHGSPPARLSRRATRAAEAQWQSARIHGIYTRSPGTGLLNRMRDGCVGFGERCGKVVEDTKKKIKKVRKTGSLPAPEPVRTVRPPPRSGVHLPESSGSLQRPSQMKATGSQLEPETVTARPPRHPNPSTKKPGSKPDPKPPTIPASIHQYWTPLKLPGRVTQIAQEGILPKEHFNKLEHQHLQVVYARSIGSKVSRLFTGCVGLGGSCTKGSKETTVGRPQSEPRPVLRPSTHKPVLPQPVHNPVRPHSEPIRQEPPLFEPAGFEDSWDYHVPVPRIRVAPKDPKHLAAVDFTVLSSHS